MPEFAGGDSRCTSRACLPKHLVCFGILQSSNCIINTTLAQLKRQIFAREPQCDVLLLRIKYETVGRDVPQKRSFELMQESAKIFTDAPVNGTIGEPKAEVFKLYNLFSLSQWCWKKSKWYGGQDQR